MVDLTIWYVLIAVTALLGLLCLISLFAHSERVTKYKKDQTPKKQ